MPNKIFILRDFAWEFNDGEPMTYSSLGSFSKQFDTYEAAFAEKKAAEIAIARNGHVNFDQLSGRNTDPKLMDKYWEYVKINLGMDVKAILESGFMQQMGDSFPFQVSFLLINCSLGCLKQEDEHIWNILQLIQLHFYEIQVFERDKMFYKLYKTPNYQHRSRYWHERSGYGDSEFQQKRYSGEIDWDGSYCHDEHLPPVIFENLIDAQQQIAQFMENRTGRWDELSDAPELLQAYIEQNNMLHYDQNELLLMVDCDKEELPFHSNVRTERNLTQIMGLLPLLKPIHIPFYVKALTWKELLSFPALVNSWDCSDYEYEEIYLKDLQRAQKHKQWQQQESFKNLKALEIQYKQIFNAFFGAFKEEFAQKTDPALQKTDSKIYLVREVTWKYTKETWYPTGLGVIVKKFNTFEAAMATQKVLELQFIREHSTIMKKLWNIHAGRYPIEKQVDKYAEFIKTNFNFDTYGIIDALFYQKHYSQDIYDAIKERLLNYTMTKLVLPNETALQFVLEMVGFVFYEVQEVIPETAFYQLALNPDYYPKENSYTKYDHYIKHSSFMVYDNWQAAQTALAEQLMQHRFCIHGTLEDWSNIPIFLELYLQYSSKQNLVYNEFQKCLSFYPDADFTETARHLLLLLKPHWIPLRIVPLSLAAYEDMQQNVIHHSFTAQAQWSPINVTAQQMEQDDLFSNMNGVIRPIEDNEYPF